MSPRPALLPLVATRMPLNASLHMEPAWCAPHQGLPASLPAADRCRPDPRRSALAAGSPSCAARLRASIASQPSLETTVSAVGTWAGLEASQTQGHGGPRNEWLRRRSRPAARGAACPARVGPLAARLKCLLPPSHTTPLQVGCAASCSKVGSRSWLVPRGSGCLPGGRSVRVLWPCHGRQGISPPWLHSACCHLRHAHSALANPTHDEPVPTAPCSCGLGCHLDTRAARDAARCRPAAARQPAAACACSGRAACR